MGQLGQAFFVRPVLTVPIIIVQWRAREPSVVVHLSIHAVDDCDLLDQATQITGSSAKSCNDTHFRLRTT